LIGGNYAMRGKQKQENTDHLQRSRGWSIVMVFANGASPMTALFFTGQNGIL
jgi:hypothetical protein